MNHDDTEYDDDWMVEQDPPPELLDLQFEPPAYPTLEDHLILPDILGDNRHHDGNILLQTENPGFPMPGHQFPNLLPELPPLPQYLPHTAMNRIQNILHDDSGQIDQNIVDSYQEITINESHLNTLIITGTNNEVKINSRHVENVIISGMNNKVIGKAIFTDSGRILKTKVKHLGISGMNNLVKNMISRDLNITGSSNKVAHVQCVNASVAQSDNQLIDCEMLEHNDTNEAHKEEYELDNQPDQAESDPEAVEQEEVHHFPSPPLLQGAVHHHHHHHLHNAQDLGLFADLPSPPNLHIPFNPHQLLEELLIPGAGHPFHQGNYDMQFDIPEADLEFELEELSRPNELQYRNLERRIKVEKYKYKPSTSKKNKEEEKKEKDERDACAICLVNLENNDKIRRLPCKHLFHSDCVMNWFKERMSCPVCRKDLAQVAGT